MSDTPAAEKPVSDPESPTTAKQLDFDDEPQDSGTAKTSTKDASVPSPKPKVSFQEEEAPPAKPPRPLSPRVQAENTLIEAFPSIDAKVVRAVLTASGGQVEPAFNALLEMTDPNFQQEDVAPRQPPRPTAAQRQLEQDEMYARQLAQHYSGRGQPQQAARRQQPGNPPLPPRRGDSDLYSDDRERSFFDDDLPEITENVRKGFVETQSKVNKWISDFRKRIEGDDDDPLNGPPRMEEPPRRQNFGSSQSEQLYGIRKSADRSRRSGDHVRYDSDPRVLDDDFTALELRDDEATPSSHRPLSNPNLFKPTPLPPQSGPVDEVDAVDRQLSREKSPGSAAKSAKWQPLTSVAPNPESEDNDPFSVGDSDEEKESKTKDVREADSTRLKEAARNSVSGGSAGDKPRKSLEEQGSIGTKDKDAEAILTGNTPS